jgi:hypothetical protein
LIIFSNYLSPAKAQDYSDFCQASKFAWNITDFSKWPTNNSEYGYTSYNNDNQYVISAYGNWTIEGYSGIFQLSDDFVLDFYFKYTSPKTGSIKLVLADIGQNKSKMEFFFTTVWQPGNPTYTIHEIRETKDGSQPKLKTIVNRAVITDAIIVNSNWMVLNKLSIKRDGSIYYYYVNGQNVTSFQSHVFPIKQLGIGLSFPSIITVIAIEARVRN